MQKPTPVRGREGRRVGHRQGFAPPRRCGSAIPSGSGTALTDHRRREDLGVVRHRGDRGDLGVAVERRDQARGPAIGHIGVGVEQHDMPGAMLRLLEAVVRRRDESRRSAAFDQRRLARRWRSTSSPLGKGGTRASVEASSIRIRCHSTIGVRHTRPQCLGQQIEGVEDRRMIVDSAAGTGMHGAQK